jgi:hypothetical protein
MLEGRQPLPAATADADDDDEQTITRLSREYAHLARRGVPATLGV